MIRRFSVGLFLVLAVVALTATAHAEVPPPLKQLAAGVSPEDIRCNHDRILVMRDGGSPACVYAETAQKKDWRTVNTASTAPSATDYGEVHEAVINSIRMGDVGEPVILNVTMINHTPDGSWSSHGEFVDKNFSLRIGVPDSFEVDESQEYFGGMRGVDSWPPNYVVYFGIDESADRLDMENLTFIPTEAGTYWMNIQNKTATDRVGHYYIWFAIDESGSYWSYDEPPKPAAPPEPPTPKRDSPTMTAVQLTDSEVREFLQKLSARHGTEVTLDNVPQYISEDDDVYLMKSAEKVNDRWEDILLFFRDVPYRG